MSHNITQAILYADRYFLSRAEKTAVGQFPIVRRIRQLTVVPEIRSEALGCLLDAETVTVGCGR